MKKIVCFIVILALLMGVSTASAFEASQLSESEYEGYLEMKEIFPEEVQLLETIAADRKVSLKSTSLSLEKDEILFQSEKTVDGKTYSLMATRGGECGFTDLYYISPVRVDGYNYVRIRSRLYSWALNLIYGHEIVTNVYYHAIAKGDSNNDIEHTGTRRPTLFAWANCTGSNPSYQYSSSGTGGYGYYTGRSGVVEGVTIYNSFAQKVFSISTGQGIKGQLYLW